MGVTTNGAVLNRGGRLRRWAIVAANAAITVSILSYLFRHVRPGDVLDLLRNADLRAIGMFAILSLATSGFRLWRYRVLLRLSGYEAPPGQLFLIVLVRNAFSDLLPARLGTLIDVYFFTTRLGIPLAAAMSTFSITFVFEILALAPLIALAAWRAGAGGALSAGGLLIGGLVLLVGTVIVLALMPWGFGVVAAVVRRWWPGREQWRERLGKVFEDTGTEVRRVQAAGLYGRVLALSVLLRLGKYASLYVFLYALLGPLGHAWSELDPARVFLGLCASEMAASLPISGIAGFGVYEGTWAVVFQLLGFAPDIAKMTSIAHHLFTQAWGYGIGLAALIALMMPIWRRRQASPAGVAVRDHPVAFYAKVVVAGVAPALLAVAIAHLPPPVAAHAAGPADRPSAAEVQALGAAGAEFGGELVFDSTRSGTFGIWRVRLDGSPPVVVADSPEHEMYPDVSPDAAWIVYARAVTLSKRSPSEIRICRPDGSDDRRLADDGTFPTFLPDGRSVLFERDRARVMRVSLEGGEPQEVFPGPRGFGGYAVVKPRVSPDGRRIVFISNRGSRRGWQVWLADLESGAVRHLGAGCEPAWHPDGRRVVFIREGGMMQGTGIAIRAVDDGEPTVLLDLDAPLGHEYFPAITADGQWLMWGACRPGQHDHLAYESNYQIFIRRLPDGPPVRVTFDGWNNRWPKRLPTP